MFEAVGIQGYTAIADIRECEVGSLLSLVESKQGLDALDTRQS